MGKYNWLLFAVILLAGWSVFAQSVDAQVAANEAPPEWLQNAIAYIYDVPVVGPYVVIVGKWFGVLITIVTAFTGFLMISVRALMGVLNLAGLVAFAAKLDAFKDGKVIYWLKYVSALFNAKKPVPELTLNK